MLAGFFYLRTVVLIPLNSLTHNANALRKGDYSTRVRIPGRDEMSELGRTFRDIILGQGFNIRDGARSGKGIAAEWAADYSDRYLQGFG